MFSAERADLQKLEKQNQIEFSRLLQANIFGTFFFFFNPDAVTINTGFKHKLPAETQDTTGGSCSPMATGAARLISECFGPKGRAQVCAWLITDSSWVVSWRVLGQEFANGSSKCFPGGSDEKEGLNNPYIIVFSQMLKASADCILLLVEGKK